MTKMKNYSLLALGLSTVLPLSCKKDKDKNDPNIDDRSINQTIAITGSLEEASGSIDVNLDGTNDFKLGVFVGSYGDSDYRVNYIESLTSGNDILADSTIYDGEWLMMAKGLSEDTNISETSTAWKEYGYGEYYLEGYLDKGAIKSGAGDKYIGFRIKSGANKHYGWMKLNVSSNGKTLIIKELAYNKTANASIKAGQK